MYLQRYTYICIIYIYKYIYIYIYIQIYIFIYKFVYMAHHFILLRLNPFDLRVDREESWFEPLYVIIAGLLASRAYKNVSWPWLSPLRG